jgi:gas vesicle protein
MDESRNLACFFLGLGVGVAVGIVFAPKPGIETRGYLKDRAGEGGDYLKRRGDQIRTSASGLVDRGREFVNRQREHLGASVDAGRQAYRESLETPDAGPTGTQIRESEGI